MNTALKDTISLPKKSIIQLGKALKTFESAQNDIEDFLIFKNKEIVGKIKRAKKEHAAGKVKDFQLLLKKYA